METQIPRTLAPFFQEYTFDNLDAEPHAELVIERTLAWGNTEELRWLFARYGRERVAGWVKRMGTRRLTRRELSFWQLILEIPESQIAQGPCEVIREPHPVWPHGIIKKVLLQ